MNDSVGLRFTSRPNDILDALENPVWALCSIPESQGPCITVSNLTCRSQII